MIMHILGMFWKESINAIVKGFITYYDEHGCEKDFLTFLSMLDYV